MAASGITAPSTASLAELPRPQLRTMKNGHGNSDGFLQVSPQTGIQQRNISITNAFNFGPFHLLPAQRLLFKDDKVIHLGSRAMDILIALVERPNELVSKAELMARVWPNTFVEPANLTVHISALRRALGDRRRAFGPLHPEWRPAKKRPATLSGHAESGPAVDPVGRGNDGMVAGSNYRYRSTATNSDEPPEENS
jgi:Transcriptional regulatory protein, C terminal